MMNPEIKAEWVAALRSGDYQQGRGALKSVSRETGEERYCCLGVLCELAVKAGLIEPATPNEHEAFRYGPDGDRESGVLPEAVRDWSGVGAMNPMFGDHTASWWNDVERVGFYKIADLIEEHL